MRRRASPREPFLKWIQWRPSSACFECIGSKQTLTVWAPGFSRSRPFEPSEGGTRNQLRFMESLLSLLRMHRDLEPQRVQLAGETPAPPGSRNALTTFLSDSSGPCTSNEGDWVAKVLPTSRRQCFSPILLPARCRQHRWLHGTNRRSPISPTRQNLRQHRTWAVAPGFRFNYCTRRR